MIEKLLYLVGVEVEDEDQVLPFDDQHLVELVLAAEVVVRVIEEVEVVIDVVQRGRELLQTR